MALVSDFGIINDFTIDGRKNETFLRLPKKICSKYGPYGPIPRYPYFGVYSDNSIFFLTGSPNSLVTKYKIEEHKHQKIPKSQCGRIIAKSCYSIS